MVKEVHQSWILGEYIHMIGYKWGPSLAGVYIMAGTSMMEKFEHK